MAESLGEKLRQAREERDISISEVAEQTRISALYLQAIEKDDYRSLPGGIFNKGFVKSFAKYVGVDENEALEDYARIVALEQTADGIPETRNYRPEVLTDDSRRGSMLPTIVFAVLILGLMAWGIHALVKYVQSTESSVSGNDSLAASNVKTEETPDANANSSNSNSNQTEALPPTDSIKLKISTTENELWIVTIADGKRENVVLSGATKEKMIEAEKSVIVNYYKGAAPSVSLELNGKKIESPLAPESYRRNGLEYEINMNNIKQILTDGKIDLDSPATATPDPNGSAPEGNPNSGNAN